MENYLKEHQQRIFDTVCEHLITQGRKALRDSADGPSLCHYRAEGPHGETLKCAIGCLIPDELYVAGMEQHNVDVVLNEYPRLRERIIPSELGAVGAQVTISLLEQLQNVHDDDCPDDWPRALRRVAESFLLDYPACIAP